MDNKSIYNNSEDEIDLKALFKIIIEGRRTILHFIVVSGLIGLFIAVFSEKEYTASTILVPQMNEAKVGANLGGLAAMAGINLGGGGTTENIPPALYPKIAQSIPFKRELLKTFLNFSNVKNEVSYKEYYNKHTRFNLLKAIKDYTIGLPSKMIQLIKENNSQTTIGGRKDSIFRISAEENRLFKQLEEQLMIDVNSKDGFIKVSFSMPEALAAAQMTQKVQELLQKAITKFKIEKAKDEFAFIEERYNELKKDFNKKQAILANFRDRNQGLITSRSQSHLEILKSEYNLSYNIYSELAKQLETQKIKVKENTPVFTIIEPVSVPVVKSKPKRALILMVWLFLGIVSGVIFILCKTWIEKFKY